MKLLQTKYYIVFVLVLGLGFQNCSSDNKRTLVYINSYHKGHPSSDEIMEGFIQNMPTDSFEIRSFYMDTKRNPTKTYIQQTANRLLDSIIKIQPDLLVISDDNAVKYIVEPNLGELKMPVVFCGVNWSADAYELPRKQVTGILEILPVSDAVKLLKQSYPEAKNLLVLNENTTTSRKEKEILKSIFQDEGLVASFSLVDNFEQWETAFVEGNKKYDLIYFSTRAAIKNWQHEEAIKVISENIKIPVFTCEDFMMPYAVIGVTKIAEEHGIWAAKTAKKMLSGVHPNEIAIAKNKESKKWMNQDLASKIGFNPNTTFLNYEEKPE